MHSETTLFPKLMAAYVTLVMGVGCGGAEAVVDLGRLDEPPSRSIDAGGGVDAGPVDAGSGLDAGVDAGGLADAGVALDAGERLDAGDGADGGASVDAGTDAGEPRPLPGADAGPPVRQVVVCLTGAVDQNSASNAGFTQLCDQLGMAATLVRSCAGSTCASSFATFPAQSAGAAVAAATFAALDRNGDRLVYVSDGPTTLTIVGFSWGGVNAGDLAEQVSADPRIVHAHLSLRLVILDAFQPFVPGVRVAANVDEAWSFRHTVTPATDCSRGAPLGPYRGVRLRCAAGRPCFDHDFSAAPNSTFGSLPGRYVGHCEVPQAAAPFVMQLVQQGTVTLPPPAVPVGP
jgi:hypothetical protein